MSDVHTRAVRSPRGSTRPSAGRGVRRQLTDATGRRLARRVAKLWRSLAAFALAALLVPRPGASAPSSAAAPPFDVAARVAELLIVRFDGPVVTPDLATMIRDRGVGGVAIYAKSGNIVDRDQLVALLAAMHALRPTPLLVAIDQEGGRVDRLAAVRGPHPSAADLAARIDARDAAAAAGRYDGADLARLGIALNFAPVVDVTRVYNRQLEARTFGDDPAVVTRLAGAYLEGLQANGRVLGVLKHFPGLGAVAADPHLELPRLDRGAAELAAVDWAPYRALVARGDVHAVMVSHVVVDALDATRPASLAPAVVTGVLRDRLGFDGVVVTDSLTMTAAAETSLGDAALAALQAGADYLLGPASVADVDAVVARVAAAVADGELDAARLAASTRRVRALRARVGLDAAEAAAGT